MALYNKILQLNAALLTVVTFVTLSLIGALGLWFTERDRAVVVPRPFIENTILVETQSPNGEVEPRTESHVYVKQEARKGERFIDTWFTSVSALCVTGLITTDFSQYTIEGQVIVMLLIQAGGLGIIVFTSIFALAVFRGLSEKLSMRKLLGSVMDSEHHDVTDMLKYVVTYTIGLELSATIIMGAYLDFFASSDLTDGVNPWWWALFHSVSAFNNAGFGLLNNNLSNFVTDPVINLTISALIIAGGLGYPVLIAIHLGIRKKLTVLINGRKYVKTLKQDLSGVASLVQIKIAIVGTIILLVLGTFVPFIVEYNNNIENGYSFDEKLMISFFHSVSTRTAGFNTVDIGAFHIATLFLYMGLMFIGANPAGTAGGIKIPTVAVLYGYIKDWFTTPGQPIVLLNRRISKFALSHAVRLFFFSTIFIVVVTFLISVYESKYLATPDATFNFQKVLFEIISAFGTVGLSMGYSNGVTSFSGILTDVSKVLVIITMFFGRIGPLTFLTALPFRKPHHYAQISPDYENSDRMQIG